MGLQQPEFAIEEDREQEVVPAQERRSNVSNFRSVQQKTSIELA
jgi:hypothetical protein